WRERPSTTCRTGGRRGTRSCSGRGGCTRDRRRTAVRTWPRSPRGRWSRTGPPRRSPRSSGGGPDGTPTARGGTGSWPRPGEPPDHLGPRSGWSRAVGLLCRQVRGLVGQGPLPLALVHETERLGERLVVEGGLDGEDPQAGAGQHLAHPRAALVQPRVTGVH